MNTPIVSMRCSTAALGSALFFVIAPCTVAGLVPWWITQWRFLPAVGAMEWTRWVGALLIIAGVAGLVDCFARFAFQGRGTPAPVAPPSELVTTGLYRFVRNPIYVANLAVIFGQTILFADWRLLTYGAAIWAAFHLFVWGFEEPTLADQFGGAYETYRTRVPRWIPRLTPWRGA